MKYQHLLLKVDKVDSLARFRTIQARKHHSVGSQNTWRANVLAFSRLNISLTPLANVLAHGHYALGQDSSASCRCVGRLI